MFRITFSNDERIEINRLIDLFLAGQNPDPIPERSAPEIDAIRVAEALPAFEDWSAFSAITRDGEIVWVDRDAPVSPRPISDPRHRRITVFAASNRFPTLASLRPARPATARTCADCRGTGRFSFGLEQEAIRRSSRVDDVRELEDRIVCFCGGLGWLLDDELAP